MRLAGQRRARPEPTAVRLAVLLVRLAAALARALPSAAARSLGRALGWAWYRLVPVRRAVARENVARALGAELGPGEREALVRAMYLHLGESFVELLRLGSRAAPPVEITGEAHLRAALAGGRGVLFLTAHLGNWEVLVRCGVLCEQPVWVVTKRLRARWAESAWRSLRAGGPRLAPAGGSGRLLLRALQRNEVVGFVLDQHAPGRHAVRVPFFGRPAATSPGLVRLARRSGAPVLPIFCRRAGDRHVVEIGTPVPLPVTDDRAADVRAGTALCVARIEAAIRAAPDQWLWIHRRWKVGPPSAPALPRSPVVALSRSCTSPEGAGEEGR